MRSTFLSACAAAGLVCGTVLGVSLAQQASERTEVRTSSTQVRRASVVLESKVVLQQDASVGKVVDFVINEDGCIEYLVIGYEESYVLVPYTVARVDVDQRVVRLNITRERFRQVPTFSKNQLTTIDAGARQKIQTFFGQGTGRTGAQGTTGQGTTGQGNTGRQGTTGSQGNPGTKQGTGSRQGTGNQGTQQPGGFKGTTQPKGTPQPGGSTTEPGTSPKGKTGTTPGTRQPTSPRTGTNPPNVQNPNERTQPPAQDRDRKKDDQ